jgi:hypothetical protein
MSTVLWANLLEAGAVRGQEADLAALHRHQGKLAKLSRQLGLSVFPAAVDSTDLLFNADRLELEPGMTSSNELMAKRGAWMPADVMRSELQKLLDHVRGQSVRFGLLRNDHAEVVADLDEALTFFLTAAAGAKANFCIVT